MISYKGISTIETSTRRLSVILTLIMSLALGTLTMGLLGSGCGTNAPTKAAQAEQIVITTANKAVQYVVKQINAGKLTQKQCDKFKTVYTDYYDAQQLVKAAIEKANATTPT